MPSTGLLSDQGIARLRDRVRYLRDTLVPKEERTGLDDIRGPEDRAIFVKFFSEVYHEGENEQIWAAKHPKEYARLVQICGQVPRGKE